MPRKPRVISLSGIYHIILRSVNQQIIFEEKSDYSKFLFILSDCKQNYDFDVYAYCLMSNHVHLLIKTHSDNLSSIFQSLGTRFCRWYNQKYQRFGHLFQERFFSAPIETEHYFLSVLLYIHENPIKGNLCQYATEYQWSSCSAYYGKQNEIIDTSYAISISGSKENILAFFSHNISKMNELNNLELEHKAFYVTNEQALEKFKQISNCKSPSDVQKLPKYVRNNIIIKLINNNLSYTQIALFCGLTKTTVYRIIKSYKK